MTATEQMIANRPAFPAAGTSHYNSGITIRDWFAGQALAGILADPSRSGAPGEYAEWAYEYADAMVARKAAFEQMAANP